MLKELLKILTNLQKGHAPCRIHPIKKKYELPQKLGYLNNILCIGVAKQSIFAVALTGQGSIEAAANLLFGVLENARSDLDSLIHHVKILEMNGESYRLNG